jgi:CHAD domain-containing protein
MVLAHLANTNPRRILFVSPVDSPMTLLEKRTKRLSDSLSSSIGRLTKDVSPKYVHRLRTTVRRIETLQAFTRPDLNKKQKNAMDELAAVRKRAGKIRDVDVQMDLLGAIANRSAGGDRKALADLLKRRRAKQATRLQAELRGLKDSKFFSHLKRITAKAASSQRRRASAAPLQQARQDLSKLGSKFAGLDTLKPSVMHSLRIRLKGVRYVAELGVESAEQRNFLSEVRTVQGALGAWHDWEELARTAEDQFGNRANCPLLVEVQALLAAKYAAAKAAVARLLSTPSAPSARKQPQRASTGLALVKRA